MLENQKVLNLVSWMAAMMGRYLVSLMAVMMGRYLVKWLDGKMALYYLKVPLMDVMMVLQMERLKVSVHWKEKNSWMAFDSEPRFGMLMGSSMDCEKMLQWVVWKAPMKDHEWDSLLDVTILMVRKKYVAMGSPKVNLLVRYTKLVY